MLTGKYRSPFLVITSLSTILLLVATFRCHTWQVTASQAVAELATCRTIAAEIKSYRSAPRTALLEKQTAKQISLTIQLAAQAAEIPDSDILRITPQQGRRQGKSNHIQQPVDVEIRQTTLGQLSRFLAELSVADAGLLPTSIRLTAPRVQRPDTKTELWASELVLTYLVYSPE